MWLIILSFFFLFFSFWKNSVYIYQVSCQKGESKLKPTSATREGNWPRTALWIWIFHPHFRCLSFLDLFRCDHGLSLWGGEHASELFHCQWEENIKQLPMFFPLLMKPGRIGASFWSANVAAKVSSPNQRHEQNTEPCAWSTFFSCGLCPQRTESASVGVRPYCVRCKQPCRWHCSAPHYVSLGVAVSPEQLEMLERPKRGVWPCLRPRLLGGIWRKGLVTEKTILKKNNSVSHVA